MTDPVFVVPDLRAQRERVGQSGTFTLPDAELRHASVKRIRDGEPVVLTDGRGAGVAGHWTAGGAGGAGTVTGERDLAAPAPRPRVTVVQAIPKSERAELAVDLAVQAGADRIIPWQADRCVSRWKGKAEKARARWEATAVSAMKQSRRLSGADVDELLTDITDLPERVGGGADPASTVRVLVLHEVAATPLAQVDLDVDELVLVIGPEGGVSDRELDVLTSTGGTGGIGGTAVVLGPEVYRTAAAAAVALGAIGVLTTRWGR